MTRTRALRESSNVAERRFPRVTLGVTLGLCFLAGLNVAGWSYFTASIEERMRNPLHGLFRPSGTIGQSIGILAGLLFLFIWLYPLRKSWRVLKRAGSISSWLEFHIIAGLLLPLAAATHASWRFDGLIGLGYAAMLVVSLSGIAGRYIYGRIPRDRSGVELNLEEVDAQRKVLLQSAAASIGLSVDFLERDLSLVRDRPAHTRFLPLQFLRDEITSWRESGRLSAEWIQRSGGAITPAMARELRKLARRRIRLDQELRLLASTQKIFRFWHVAHRPIAVTALLAVLTHIGVAIAMGATWFW